MSEDIQGVVTEIVQVGSATLEYVVTSKDNIEAAIKWAGGSRVRTIYQEDVVSTRIKKNVEFPQRTSEKYEDVIFNLGDVLAKDEDEVLHIIKPALFAIITSSATEQPKDVFKETDLGAPKTFVTPPSEPTAGE